MRRLPIAALLAAGCGTGLECGRGTVERDGVCVAVERPADDTGPTVPDGPRAVLSPASFPFGDLGVGCAVETAVRLANGGNADLVIDAIDYVSATGAFALDPATVPALPLTLVSGDTVDLRVTAVPLGAGPDTGQLSVVSNDPSGTAYAVQTLEGAWGQQTDSFVATTSRVDVLLMIDHSCSMEDNNRPEVEAGIPVLVDALDLVGDWQIGMVTANDGCVNGGIVDPSTPNGTQYLVDHAFDAGPVFGTYLTEALLQLGAVALAQTDPGECNEGLLRPSTPLYVLMVSDEREQSGLAPLTLVGNYQTYVPDVVISVVVDLNLNCGDGSGPDGYVEAADATGGVVMDICSNWGPDMDDLVAGVPSSPDQVLDLTVPATDPPLEVRVDGVPTVDFTWEPALNRVTVHGDIAEGTPIDVTYPIAATCSP